MEQELPKNLVFREGYEKERKELEERQQKRQAVVEKHKDALDAMIVGKKKGIRYRRYFHQFVFHNAYMVFFSEEEEYQDIGKVDRRRWSSYEDHKKTFTKDEFGVVGDIIHEFGAYDY